MSVIEIDVKTGERTERDYTLAERQAIASAAIEHERNFAYDVQRQLELSTLDGEGLDAIRKALVAVFEGKPAPKEFIDYVTKVDEIKTRIPK